MLAGDLDTSDLRGLLDADALTPRRRLDQEIALRNHAALLYERALREASLGLEGAQARYQSARKNLAIQIDRVHEAAAAVQRDELERSQEARWAQRRTALEEQLLSHYGAVGPQYQILARRLAHAEVHAEQMEESGRDIEATEWRRVISDVRELIGALQKYTESSKTEIVRTEVQGAIIAVLRIVEELVQPEHPQLWSSVVREVEARVATEPS